MTVRTHLAWHGADVVAAAHSLVEGLLHSACVIVLDAAVHHELELSVREGSAALANVGEDGNLVLAIVEAHHRVHRVIVAGNRLRDVVRLRV